MKILTEVRALEPMQCPYRWPNKTLFIEIIMMELCYIEVHREQSELMATLAEGCLHTGGDAYQKKNRGVCTCMVAPKAKKRRR